MKLYAIFRGCTQDGIDHFSDYAHIVEIPLSEQQKTLLIPPERMTFSELILDTINGGKTNNEPQT